MKLKIGDTAPLFSYGSVNNDEVNLEDYRGKKVLIVFSRYFGCPVCQLDFDDLVELSKEIEIDVIYFTQSTPESALKYSIENPVDFPIIPVPEENGIYKVYEDYGVGSFGISTGIKLLMRARKARKTGKTHGDYEGKETQSPADFIIDEEGNILRVNIGIFDAEKIKEVILK